jgi:hypothetical protein
MLNCLAVLIAHSAPSFISFHPISVFSLLVPTSESRHYFSFSCTLLLQVLRNFLCHTPLILPVVSGFFDSVPSFLLVLHSSIFLLPLIFPLLHWHTRFSDSISLSPSLSCFFLFSTAFRQYPALFPSTHFVFKLCSSLSRFHLHFLLHFLLHFFYLFSFPPSLDLCPVHQYTLYHGLDLQHHSPPEITSPLSLSYSPNTSTI